uniref:Mitochondrial ribonuclease P protein 3 n=1 Tax=Aceria tosichella TaxID=561515 RepID=A0A6G1S6G1_9ACAR
MRAQFIIRAVQAWSGSTRSLATKTKKLDLDRTGPRMVGLSLVRALDREEEECLYPTFRQLQVATVDRVHSFSVPCDRVIKFIKLGAINKQIAQQYCHYIAHLSRSSDTQEDSEYYSRRCGDLLSYIMRTGHDIPAMAKTKLLCDVADTSKENCIIAIKTFLRQEKLPSLTPREFSQLFGSCCRFSLWTEARQILSMSDERMLTFRICDPLILGLENASQKYKELAHDPSERALLRDEIIETLYTVCELFSKHRVQFIAKNKSVLSQALIDLDIKVVVNSNIKMSGRCTSCETHLPIFDSKSVADINESIRSQIFSGADKGLYLNTSPNDASRFVSFLRDMYNLDKKPIDCVIDGLNIAYRTSTGFNWIKQQLTEDVSRTYRVPKVENQSHTLINTIIRGNMLQQFKKILVVGKAHMLKWPGLMDFFRKNNIRFYSSFNNSKDDLFQLYASTLSPKTVLVTNDFLRDHLATLDESARTQLERWIDTHQAWICQKTLKPIWPTPYEKIASVDRERNCFHLPVIDFDQLETVGVTDPPPHLNSKALTWLCCRTANKVSE